MKPTHNPALMAVAATVLMALPLMARAADEEADQFWDSETVDKAVQLSGAMMASGRLTALPDDPQDLGQDELTFQVEHTHVKVAGDLTNHLSYEVMPCLTHMDEFSVITAFFNYEFGPALQVTSGRFLLPFGGFNERSLPGGYAPVSRPLLYQSHEDRYIGFDVGTPQSLFFTPRDDIGVLASGSVWLGSGDNVQVWYGGYVTNGPRPDSNTMARHWDDNNNAKALGGRAVISADLDPIDFSLGGSALVNRYRDEDEESLWGPSDQVMWSGDFELGLRWGDGHRLAVLGEYTRSHQEIEPTDELASGDSTIEGWYIETNTMITGKLGVFAQYDHLDNLLPAAQVNEAFHDDNPATDRTVAGLIWTPASGLQVKPEYGYWHTGQGLPDAHRFGLQTILTF